MRKILIGLGILLLIGGIAYLKTTEPKKLVESVVAKGSSAATDGTNSVSNLKPLTERSFSVDVQRPVNGTIKGVVEVGASGFNSFVVNIDKEKNWEIVSKEFGSSLAYEGFADQSSITTGLRNYLSQMFNKGVAGRNAHFVISSGALKNPKTVQIAEGIQKLGYVVNKVTPEQEGKYALKALLSKNYQENSYVVDIGSGNTKISWYEGSSLKSVELPGAKYYQDGKTDDEVYNQIKEAANKVPLAKRSNCFIIGGVPFKLAEKVRNSDERFTLLQSPDYYSAGDDVKIKSGLNIYRAIVDATSTQNFIFDWDANFTIGFLLSIN
jgi:hypothetical protein